MKQDNRGSPQLDRIERLMPHARQFATFRQAVANAASLGASLTSLLDKTRVSFIQLDRNGRILAANDRARVILDQRNGLSDLNGFLHAWLPADNVRLGHLVARALPAPGVTPTGGSMMVRRLFGLPGLVLHVNPATVRRLDFGASGVGALVLVVDPWSKPGIRPETVVEALNLTPAQSRVTVLLARGYTLRDIAAATGRSETTVASHLKAIYRKLGISRRAELAQLVHPLTELSLSEP